MKNLFSILLICFPFLLFSQNKIHKICSEETYNAPPNVSLEDAKRIAIERAKIKALADEFGTLISQTNTSVIQNNSEQSNIDFKSLSASEVKGEWLEDTEEPQTQILYEQNMLIVKATVCGKAREITRASINFTSKVLRNGKDDKYESDQFNENDDLFLSFQSPAEGYLAVYLIDDEQKAFCLLPYSKDNDGQVYVEHGQRYLFFDVNSAPEKEKKLVDEFSMTCTKAIEYNQIYIIFSPNPFTKANDNQIGNSLPRELSYQDFQQWLTKNRNVDEKMQVELKTIQINKK